MPSMYILKTNYNGLTSCTSLKKVFECDIYMLVEDHFHLFPYFLFTPKIPYVFDLGFTFFMSHLNTILAFVNTQFMSKTSGNDWSKFPYSMKL